ncbi:TonB-dependent receptor [Sphingorhabdus contaminans]|nr:TonB-dependent receptor [Sphingorhabdus contaminans]
MTDSKKFLGLLATTTCIVAMAMPAQAQVRSYDIQAGDMQTALDNYARQSGRQLIYKVDEVKGKRSKGARGNLSADAALKKILAGTGFQARIDTMGAIAIAKMGNGGDSSSGFRAAAAGSEESVSSNGEASPNAGGAALSSDHDDKNDIVVTGSHIRGVDTAAPSITIDRSALERTGYSSVAEVFQRVPQNFTDISAGTGSLGTNIGTPLSSANASSRSEGVNLRGLGANSTLVLLDGKRRAGSIGGRVVDISVLPISLIKSIEIVFGGRSAVYGSDAVGGVVNFVTRKDFEGAETTAFFSTTEKGGERFQASQLVGVNGDAGNIVAAYDYSEDWEYDLVNAGYTQPLTSPFDTQTFLALQAQQPSRRHSAYVAGELSVNDVLQIYVSGLYSTRRSNSFFSIQSTLASKPDTTQDTITSEQYSITGGARTALSGDWELDISGTISRVNEKSDTLTIFNRFGPGTETRASERQSDILDFSAIVDGPLFTIGGITPKAAFGIEARSEALERVGFTNTVVTTPFQKQSRSVQSAFLELNIPLMQGSQSLDISLAGRFDRYSDFGDTFNPHFGVIYSPIAGLTIKGAYSTAFRAPDVINLGANSEFQIFPLPDPQSSTGFSNVLVWQGDASGLRPESAETWTVSAAYQPEFAPWLSLSAGYFSVNYDDRIDRAFPTFTDVFNAFFNPDIYVDQIERTPSAARINEILETAENSGNFTGIAWDPATQNLLDAIPDIIVLDVKTSNVASEKIRGIDFSVSGKFATEIGDISISASGAYVLKHNRQITLNAPFVSRLNDVGKPVDFKLQGQVNWTREAYSLNAIVNYTDGYRNSFVNPVGSIDSFTTVDISTSVNLGEIWQGPVSKGLRFTLNINNLFDARPPRFESTSSTTYDHINASPFGRTFSVRLVKNW